MSLEQTRMEGESCITWAQPSDVDDPDVVVVNGTVLEVSDETARLTAASRISEFADRVKHVPLAFGGWKGVALSGQVMEIPVVVDQAGDSASLLIFMTSSDEEAIADAVAQVMMTAELAGYLANEEQVAAIVRHQPSRPKGLLARAWMSCRGIIQSVVRIIQSVVIWIRTRRSR